MAFIRHPFSIEMLFAFESRNFVVFILEFCSGGELFYQLKNLKRMSEEQA
jgi:serum/glucocorticoid-regulated kinase 2